MPGAVASEVAATASHERGWRWFVLALVLMVVATAAPIWPPAFALPGAMVRMLLPVEQLALMVVVVIAACAVVGWWAGGRLLAAIIWVAAAGYVLWQIPLSYTGYGAFVRGWALALGASFGLVCLTTRSRPLLGRALAAVALTTAVTLAGINARPSATGGVFADPAQMMGREYQRRVAESVAVWRDRAQSEPWQRFSRRFPDAAERMARMESLVVFLGSPTTGAAPGTAMTGPVLLLVPALLALESLLAVALGWAAYHRLSRVRIGPPLGALRDLRFNDQLVWGLIVGVTILLLPTLVEWRMAGVNLICFFGTLYALRGAGVLSWWIPDRFAAPALLGVVVLVPIVGPMWVVVALFAITFGLGLGDTWRNFRTGARGRPSSAS